jgi:hypothetical protein
MVDMLGLSLLTKILEPRLHTPNLNSRIKVVNVNLWGNSPAKNRKTSHYIH